jgi:hypothetical protein
MKILGRKAEWSVKTFETPIMISQTTQCHVPEDNNFESYCRENSKSLIDPQVREARAVHPFAHTVQL